MNQASARVALAAVALAGLSCAAQAGIVSSGSFTLPGTWLFDFDAGVLVDSHGTPADIWWEQINPSTRQVVVDGTASIASLGSIDFNAFAYDELAALSYSNMTLNGSDVGNILLPGYVFAIHTDLDNYAKIRVTAEFDRTKNNGLVFDWVTYSIPSPASASTLALAAFAGLRRRRALRDCRILRHCGA
ncbi:MAG: hypothetical protein SFY96_04600 [Planctomycetota bacterium]|nr:hypothetical protein [Planctomycetota bacterium]